MENSGTFDVFYFGRLEMQVSLDNSQKCEPMLIFLSSLMHQAFAVCQNYMTHDVLLSMGR